MNPERSAFFDATMYAARITGWPAEKLRPAEPVRAPAGARFELWQIDPDDARPDPDPDGSTQRWGSTTFSLVNSGNRTKFAPKRSWRVNLEPGDDHDRITGMERLNLKSMYNDPSQQREALAWSLFADLGIAAPRHSYTRLSINGRYQGLLSLIEQVDRRFLHDRFGADDRGNLYKAGCGDLGCATLEYRTGDGGRDDGSQYRSSDPDDPTYKLSTNEDDPAANGHQDLAQLIRTINGIGLPGGERRFGSDAFRESVEQVLDVPSFLTWAALNVLLGSWDNYFATPANYYLYNGGRPGAGGDFLDKPYFRLIPWDYDNCLGIDYTGTAWQYTDLMDWPANTVRYWRRSGRHDHVSRIPLVTNLLANHDLAEFYLDRVEQLLDSGFSTTAICARMGTPDGQGLWQRVCRSAYLESDSPGGQPFTGRQFSNDEVYQAGFAQRELQHANASILGIYHYVRMRYDSARGQLGQLRAQGYRSGATTPSGPGPALAAAGTSR